MRNILLTLFVLFTAIQSYGQGITPGSTPTGTVYDRGGHVVDSMWITPYRDTLFPTWVGSQRKNGAVVVKSSNNTPYYYANGAWRAFSSGSGSGVDTSAWHKSGDSIALGRFLGPTNDQPFVIKRNGITFLTLNVFDGIQFGKNTTLAATGTVLGEDSYNTGFRGMSLGGGYNEGSQALSMMIGAINTGDRSVVIGRGAYSNKSDVISIGTTSRSTHIGNFIANDGMYNPSNFNSRKDYEFITHYTNGYHFETAMPGTFKYVDIDSFGTVDATNIKFHSGVPAITFGTGAGSSGTPTSYTQVGNNQAGTITITPSATPAAGATIFTLTFASGLSYTNSAVMMIFPENDAAATVFGPTGVKTTGTTNSVTLQSGTVALSAGTYIFKYITSGY